MFGRRIPAANQAFPVPVLRIRSIGLAQGKDGAGESMSSILKSPVRVNGTPVRVVLFCVNGAAAWQMSVAKTD